MHNTLNALLRNATLTEVEASLALMIEKRTFSEQGNRMLGILNDTIDKCRTIEQENNTVPFVYDFDFYRTSIGVVELKMNANQEIKMNILTQKVRLLWEVVPRIAIDDDNIALPILD